jgi:RND family efflux transporter MFP subunit
LYRNSTGTLVKKDEPLASFYSPEFLSAQQAYIFALNSLNRFEAAEKETPGQVQLTKANVQQYADTLRNLGMGETQIEEIARTRRRTQDIEIRSPAPGFVIARNVSLGQKFTRGAELFKIADLRRVWILADLFENEARYLQSGKSVKVTLPHQAKVFQAKVSNVLPQFDPATRTLKVRLEADNPGYTLRPDMFVDVELPVTFPPAVVVPADAVLDSGIRKTVFVDRGNGVFEPREVETGWRFANRVEIVKGIEPGERIVISGNFLIDSESRTELAAAGMSGTLEKDPVCGSSVSVKKALKEGRTSVHQGKTYYFSSSGCKEKFDRDPVRYSAKPMEGND